MSYKNAVITLAVVAAIAFPVAAFADAPAVANTTDSSAGASAPATAQTTDSSAGSAPAAAPATDSSAGTAPASASTDSSAGTAPSTGTTGSSAASTPSTGNTGSSAGSAPASNPGNGGSTATTGGGSSSGSSSGGGSSVYAYPIIGQALAATTSCPLISSYMRLGMANNSADVTKLQGFLKNSEHLNVEVTGTFDAKTEAAVEAFQKKYLSDILGPWNATKATGVVYITTLKKINQLACSQPLSLNANELATIRNYNNKTVAAPSSTNTPVVTSPVTGPTGPVGPTMENTVGSSVDANANTAAAANTTILGKFWNFLKNLF